MEKSDLKTGIMIALVLWFTYTLGHWNGSSEERAKKSLIQRMFGLSGPVEKAEPYVRPNGEDATKGPLRRFFNIAQLPPDIQEMHRLHENAAGFTRNIDADLCRIAQTHSEGMSLAGLSHSNFRNRLAKVKPGSAGENVAFGYKVERIFQGFMDSPGHRDNILNKSYNSVGYGMFRRGDRMFWTIIFANLPEVEQEETGNQVLFEEEHNEPT